MCLRVPTQLFRAGVTSVVRVCACDQVLPRHQTAALLCELAVTGARSAQPLAARSDCSHPSTARG